MVESDSGSIRSKFFDKKYRSITRTGFFIKIYNKLPRFIQSYVSFFLQWASFSLLVLGIWSIRYPFIFKKVYAEDGNYLLMDAIEKKNFAEFLDLAPGYSILIQRLGARFISNFPLDLIPLAIAGFSSFTLGYLAVGIFRINNLPTKSFLGRLTLALGFLFLPISAFSAVGNITNLYVYFMLASAVFLVARESSKLGESYKLSVYLIAVFSLPLCIFLVPIIISNCYRSYRSTNTWKPTVTERVFILGLTLHFVFILFFSNVSRAPRGLQSIDKVIYLYLDRAIGSSLIPNWGFVSGSSESIKIEHSMFFTSATFRLLISGMILSVMLGVYLRFRKTMTSNDNYFIQSFYILGLVYSMLIGTLYNPEPRYMMFPAFITFWLAVYLFDVISQRNSLVHRILHLALITVLIFGLNASSHRSIGPDWENGLREAREQCKDASPNKTVKFRTLPLSPQTFYETTCNDLN